MFGIKPLFNLFSNLVRATFGPNDQEEGDSCYDYEYIYRVDSTITLRHTGPEGIGYDSGYTTLDALFFPFSNAHELWPFIDLRAHYFNNSEWAANAGLGFRYYSECGKRAYGIHGFFDYRSDDDHDFHYTQVGFGIEVLGQCYDVRVNGYFPIQSKNDILNCFFTYPGDFFIDRKKFKAALAGFNLELGRYLCRSDCFQFYAAVGPYFYGGECCRTPFGGQFRVYLQYSNYITPCGIKQQILSQPIRRNEIIVLDEFCKWKFNF